jgi:hypothetical protein
MGLVDQLTDPAGTWAKEWRRYLARQTRRSGCESLALLRQFATVKPGRLSQSDRERMATALHCEVERLSGTVHDGLPFSKAAWMRGAGLDEPGNATKRYGEFVLAPWYSMDYETWEERRNKLSAGAGHFGRLIEALFVFSSEAPEQVCRRIFAGTSFAGDSIDPERYTRAAGQLQALVRAADALVGYGNGQEGIEGLFTRTAQVKRRMLAMGSRPPSWPYPDWFYPSTGVLDIPSVYWDERDSADCDMEGPGAHAMFDTKDPRYRNLLRMTFGWLDSLVHLPRAYMGCISFPQDLVGDVEQETDEIGLQLAVQDRLQYSLVERRELATGRTRIQGIHPADLQDGPARAGQTIPLQERRHPEEEDHCWLVIYPAKGGKGLCPMLYWPRAEAGVFVCPLNANNLHVLSEFCVTSDNGVMTLFERLEQMLTTPLRHLAHEWARTAFDLCSNPVLEMASMVE